MSDGLTHTSLVRLLFAVLPCVLAAIAFDLHSSSLLLLLFTLACYRSVVLYHSAGSGGLTKADKDAKNARKVQKKKKKLTNDWRFWAAIIAGIGFTSAAFNVYSSQSGNIDDRPVGTSVQTPPNLPSAPKLKNPGELII